MKKARYKIEIEVSLEYDPGFIQEEILPDYNEAISPADEEDILKTIAANLARGNYVIEGIGRIGDKIAAGYARIYPDMHSQIYWTNIETIEIEKLPSDD